MVHHRPEYSGRETIDSSSGVGSNNSSRKRDSNNKLILTKDFKGRILAIKDQNDIQDFMYQFNINSQGN